MSICFSCFKTYNEEYDICPHCGSVKETAPKEPIHLIPGTLIQNRYIIGTSVGSGGFGIVYKAWDTKLETIVAVKEFFVSHVMTRASGEKSVIVSKKSIAEYNYRKERFLAEARAMAKFGNHPSIPNVFDFFEENGTAYIVMELLEGQPLNEFLADNGGKIDPDFALMIVNEVGRALISLHDAGIIHRDVAPDNIFICSKKDLSIKLLDLGAAKLADHTDKFIDVILKPGYSPVEQYDKTSNVGTWSDIYALGATLYVMLTGIKPEESTNRKEEDRVLPPSEINENISENLSNSVMKAMALEKHMRFKTVDAFLKAIHGERKVVPLALERKQRKRKRLFGVLVACFVVLALGIGVYKYYDNKKSEQLLKDATISVWYGVSEGSTEDAAMASVAEQFMETFGNVKVELKSIPDSQYKEELQKAAEKGELPTLFESTNLDDSILEMASDVTNILQTEQAENCLFLDQYDNYYQNHKKIPLGFQVPMAFVITSGAKSVAYSDSYFTQPWTDTEVAVDEKYNSLIRRNFSVSPNATKNDFMNPISNTCAVLYSSSMGINEARQTLTNYEKSYVYYKADKIYCEFNYEYSIGKGSENEIAAAERLLTWMLGNVYQDTLMISQCNDGQLPINKTCFETKVELKNYAPIKEIYQNFVFSN